MKTTLAHSARLVALALLVVACGGPQKPKHPGAIGRLGAPLAEAFEEEATGDPAKAVDRYVRALAGAAASPEDPAHVAVIMASLDALVHRNVAALGDVGASSSLDGRTSAPLLAKKGGTVDERLAKVEANAEGPFATALIAHARLSLAERRGDIDGAAALRARTGCAREAALFGPLAWTPVSRSNDATGLDEVGAAMPADVAGPSPFSPRVRAAKIGALGCHLPLYAESGVLGIRDVLLDVEVPHAGFIGVALRTSSAASLRAGGQRLIERPHALGGGFVATFARVEAKSSGVLRLVARVGMHHDYETIELDAWDDSGKPLHLRAPKAGEKSTVAVGRVQLMQPAAPTTDDERLAVALGALAAHDAQSAENLLHPQISRADAPPSLLLVYARAVRSARDLPAVKSTERARGAVERVQKVWPSSWEAALEHAVLAGVRRGQAEANIEALTDLEKARSSLSPIGNALADAFDAATAGRERIYDRARSSFSRAREALDGTALIRGVEGVAFERTGADEVAFACDAKSRADQSSLACHRARAAVGDRVGAENELERLRALAEAPQLYLSISSRSALEQGDLQRAETLMAAMNPADRQLSTLFAIKGKSAVPEILRLAGVARDAPQSLPGILRAAGDDPLEAFAGIAERVTSDDKGSPALANAATLVLTHQERYDLEASGLLRFTMLDVRRVMGTTDVDSNAQASAPQLYGRDVVRVLRRRIFKKDGRILLPDATPRASQSHADLSQLEAGDAVEAIYEGWGIPGDMGNVGIDTPDLLPERTAVRDARVELRLPSNLQGSLWSHPMLGKAAERSESGKRILVWKVSDRPIRRIESGVPKMDRSASVSFSTTTWDNVAQGFRESMAALDSVSPEVTAWARTIEGCAGPAPCVPTRALVEKLVAASGVAVKEATGVSLSDLDLGRSGSQGMTARTSLATHEGSRTWLIVRALRELGVHVDVLVAENEPFSDSASFPPHFGRFMHPLAVAHVPNPAAPEQSEDIWIDADVSGPPLPAGRISPELRGRNALRADGRIAPLPLLGTGTERDEIDERLVVDEQGNAKGVLTVLLRGRSAQDLAEALVRLVGNERQRALRGIALAWVPFATVEKVELSSSEGSWQVAIRAELSAPAYAQIEGTKAATQTWILPGVDPIHYVFPRPYVTTLSAAYASQSSRDSALAVNHATQYHLRRRVELPSKAKIKRLPGPFEAKGPLLNAQRSVSVAGTTVEEDFTLDLVTGTIPKERYDAFVSETHRTDDAFRASTHITPP